MDLVLLPFEIEGGELDLDKLANGDGTYSFRGREMRMARVPLPEGYVVQTPQGPAAGLAELYEVGEKPTLNLISICKAYETPK